MTGTSDQDRRGDKIRAKIPHPVLDTDGHVQELDLAIPDYLKRVAGPDVVKRFEDTWFKPSTENVRRTLWNVPSGKGTKDRAMAMLPKLRMARQEECGIDFAVIYSTRALGIGYIQDAEMRTALCRAINIMNSEKFAEFAAHMTPAAVIPVQTPDEGIAELEFAIGELGMKAIMVNGDIRGPNPKIAELAPELAHHTRWTDSLAIDAPFDFDPFWKKCAELKVGPACHSSDRGGGHMRSSPTNYVFNHLGGFAAGSEFFCRSLFMGGVPKRFPGLNFGFLEGGVSWAAQLYNDICEHWEKRNIDALLENLDPEKLDRDLMVELFEKYGDENLTPERIADYTPGNAHNNYDRNTVDEFAACGIGKEEDIKGLFTGHFFFGCESDDRMVATAFDPKLNAFGAKLKAFWGSDIGHWDVTDASLALSDAYGMLEEGLLNAGDFEEFMFTNGVLFHAGMNPDFFKGTVLEAQA
ncbi:MAG: amidohydrolase family protein, partial [Rhodospirillales bacterium]|nr:amidohydrolase family protein [Rhodospirillales bacterium]